MPNPRSHDGPTLASVAQRAGCSPITVSRVLNSPEIVSPELRERVIAAAAELSYHVNVAARTLASIRTNTVGVILPSLTIHIFTDVLRGIYDGVRDTNLRVMLGNSHYDQNEEERLIREFLGQKPAAMIVSGIEQTASSRRMLEAAKCPVIQIMDLDDDPIECIIGFSHFDAGYQITRHLVEQGYRRIGFMAGWVNKRSLGRLNGWRRALEEAGIYDPARVLADMTDDRLIDPSAPDDLRYGDPSSALHGRMMLRKLLAVDGGIDAVFCNNDIFAVGALFEAQALRLRVPEDLGIAGFNDTDLVRASHPPLSSLRTPRYEIGLRAAGEAVCRLDQNSRTPAIIDLGIEVAVRTSTMRPQASG